MFCKYCGAELTENEGFCPQCKEKIPSHEEEPRVPRWFKWLAGIFLCFLCLLILSFVLTPDLNDTVREQLEALKLNKITEAYYNYTAKEFRNIVSLEKFRQFVKEYPFLANPKSVKFIDRSVDGEHGDLKAVFHSQTGNEILTHFRLIKEEEKWRILGISLESKGHHPVSEGVFEQRSKIPEAFDASPIYNTIREQMEKIRVNDLADAYYRYTGKDFQISTSLKQFETFINSHPGFKNNLKIDLNHLSFDNNIAEVKGDLISTEGKVYQVEYNLAFESQRWKINYVHIIPKAEVESEKINLWEIAINDKFFY